MFLLSSLLHSVPTQPTLGTQTYSTEMYTIVGAALLFILLLTGVQAARDEEQREWQDE